MEILNGYVDLEKLDLYKKNNRIKEARIVSTDGGKPFSFVYSFDDFVRFTKIAFPRVPSSVRIEILSVYEGTQYEDTCVTAITGNDDSAWRAEKAAYIKAELAKKRHRRLIEVVADRHEPGEGLGVP